MRFILLFLSVFILQNCSAQQINFNWAQSIGDTLGDYGKALAFDNNGNLISAGAFSATVDFDAGPAIYNLSAVNGTDTYIMKTDTSGKLIWARQFAGANNACEDLATDPAGNIYICGSFLGTVDFDPGAGIYNLSAAAAASDAFMVKLDTGGNFIWALSIGNAGSDQARTIELDSWGNIYVTGIFSGTVDFDPGTGVSTISTPPGSGTDMYLLKLDANGIFSNAKAIHGPGSQLIMKMVINNTDVYCTGRFQFTVDFDPDTSQFNLTSTGQNLFILKLDTALQFHWAKSAGSTYSTATIMQLENDELFVAGIYNDTADLDPGPGIQNQISNGGNDCYLMKLDTSGNVQWLKSFGGSGHDGILGLQIQQDGSVYAGGYFIGAVDFDPGSGISTLIAGNADELYFLKLNSNGDFVWAYKAGSPAGNVLYDLLIDSGNSIYSTGSYFGFGDFDPSPGVYNLNGGISGDIYQLKFQDNTFTGISENNQAIMQLYPNPATGNFKIVLNEKYTRVKIHILNISGQLISGYFFENTDEISVDCDLSPGMYIVEVICNDERYYSKLIVR
jgi:hypothetical protein